MSINCEYMFLSVHRFLLARAESNLYGRLTLAELVIMAQEVSRGVRRHGYGPRSTIHQACVSIALPQNQERDVKLSYMDKYSCKPPPIFMLLISLSQICVFVYHVILLTNQHKTVGPNGPVYLKVCFIWSNKFQSITFNFRDTLSSIQILKKKSGGF